MAEGLNLSLIVMPTYFVLASNQNAYSLETVRNRLEMVRRPVFALLLTALLVILYTFLTKSGVQVSRAGFAVAITCSAVAMIAGRLSVDGLVRKILQNRLTDELLIIDGGDIPVLARHLGLTIIDARKEGLVKNV